MKNNRHTTLLVALAAAMMALSACGTFKKAATVTPSTTTGQTTPATTTADPCDEVIATLGNWQTMQTSGNISLKAGSSFSSSIQMRMVRDQAIYISLRPLLGIEVGRLLITGDSLYAVDKVHKRYIAEKVSLLTSGIPVTVSDVQDMFLGRPFILGKGTLNESLKGLFTTDAQSTTLTLTANELYRGYSYAFSFDKAKRIVSLNITPQGSATAAYQVRYSDVKSTQAGNIAHSIKIDANVQRKQLDLSLTLKGIDWNGNVKIDRSVPTNYTRMNAADLLSIFSN